MLKRRDFLKELGSSGIAFGLVACSKYPEPEPVMKEDKNQIVVPEVMENATVIRTSKLAEPEAPMVRTAVPSKETQNLKRVRNFNQNFEDDLYLEPSKIKLLKSSEKKLSRVKEYIGYGHFNLLSFDEMIAFSKRYSKLQAFTPAELDFLDEVFHFNAQLYGFWGNKVLDKMTAKIDSRDVAKVPRTGHFVFKGEAQILYAKIRKEIGPSIVLTSGVRGIVKQLQLFLAKSLRVGANMSRASRSLAPPGHSYHGVGDFDVGKVGLGASNFTSQFAQTDEYRRLTDSGYIKIRYTRDNPYGVRYEPWHIKVVKS